MGVHTSLSNIHVFFTISKCRTGETIPNALSGVISCDLMSCQNVNCEISRVFLCTVLYTKAYTLREFCIHFSWTYPNILECIHIVAFQAHPALVEICPALVPSFYLARPPVYGLQGYRTVSRRGSEDWRFVGDPAPLSRDNILTLYTLLYTHSLYTQCIPLTLRT